MTFAEIGAVEGVSAARAFCIFSRGMKKLRKRNPETIETIQHLARLLELARDNRERGRDVLVSSVR